MSTNFSKVVNPGRLPDGEVFCKIEFTDGKLSISGVVGPMRNGECRGSCGQISMSFKEYDSRGYMTLDALTPADGWTTELIKQFFDAWNRWHLNDMRAGCEHQRANRANWVRQDEHPRGVLSKPCPVCGYKYGNSWLREEIPVDVIEFLQSLPSTSKTPAWV